MNLATRQDTLIDRTHMVTEDPNSPNSPPDLSILLGASMRVESRTSVHTIPAMPPAVIFARVLEGSVPDVCLLYLSEGRHVNASVATSCIIRPIPGDLVSAVLAGDKAWVTSILERDPVRAVELDLGRSALSIRAREISLEAGSELKLAAHKMSSESRVSIARCGDRFAHVDGTDSTQSRCTLLKATGHLGLHAGDARISAEALIKVDAGQVHMC